MSQMSFGDAECAGKWKKTRREVFLEEMDQIVPWKSLVSLIEPVYREAGRGRHPCPQETMLRVHLMQSWFGLSDPAMEEALYEITPMRVFAGLSLTKAIPDETTILNFRARSASSRRSSSARRGCGRRWNIRSGSSSASSA
jgi:transposase, IS5 family